MSPPRTETKALAELSQVVAVGWVDLASVIRTALEAWRILCCGASQTRAGRFGRPTCPVRQSSAGDDGVIHMNRIVDNDVGCAERAALTSASTRKGCDARRMRFDARGDELR